MRVVKVSPLGYLGNGPHCDQDGDLCEQHDIPGGAETVDTDEESDRSGLTRERRRCANISTAGLML